jgi:hypothetical protein
MHFTNIAVTTDYFEQDTFGRISEFTEAIQLESLHAHFLLQKNSVAPATPPDLRMLWHMSAKELAPFSGTAPPTGHQYFDVKPDADLVASGDEVYNASILGGDWHGHDSVDLRGIVLPRYPSMAWWYIGDGTADMIPTIAMNLYYRLVSVTKDRMKQLLMRYRGRGHKLG